MEFLAGGILGGLGLIAIPILIHILNRRRFRVVQWAPMRYLKLAIKTTRRRIRLEHLVLLLVRCLMVAAAVFMLARPAVRSGGAASWLGGDAAVSSVLVVDDTLSMNARIGNGTSLSLAREVSRRLVGAMGRQDLLTILRASRPETPVLRESAVGNVSDLDGLLDGIARGGSGTNWLEVLREARRLVTASTFPVKRITLVTDLRREGWSEEISRVTSALADDKVALRIVDVGVLEPNDIAVLALEATSGVVVPGLEARFSARLRNSSGVAFGPTSARLSSGEAARTVTIPRIEPKESVDVPLTWTFATAGTHDLTLTLPGDDLVLDDSRTLVVEVRASLDALLVDGEPSEEPFDSEIDFLSVALTVGDVPWRVYGVTDSEWLSRPGVAVDLTVLANVAALTPEAVSDLERLVSRGMGLMIFPGDQSDLGLMDTLLWRDGQGLLPARITETVDAPVRGLVLERHQGSPLAPLEILAPEALAEIAATRRASFSLEGAKDARVLARWDDPDRSSALVEKRFGRGRVLVWSLTADRAWSEWPVDPTYLLAMRETTLTAARPGASDLTLVAGHEVSIRVGESPVSAAELHLSGDEQSSPLEVASVDGEYRVLGQRIERLGLHRIAWVAADGERVQRLLCVVPLASECDLTRIDPTELQAFAGRLTLDVVHHANLAKLLEDPARELWRRLFWAVIAFFAMESLLMVFVGRKG